MSEYIIKEISTTEIDAILAKHAKSIFGDRAHINYNNLLEPEQLSRAKELDKALEGKRIFINLAVYKGDELVGWSKGFQERMGRFYMQNSVIFPEHRKKGLYTRLLNEMISRVKKVGFSEIYSRHTISDNPILISKLKAGFVISSVEISPIFGTLLHLSYYLDDRSRKVMDYRTGMIIPDDEIMNLLKK